VEQDFRAEAGNVEAGNNEHFAKHGGVHFRTHASPQEINRFIRRLPAGKRESLFEVLDQLDQAGLISIVNDHLFADGHGVIGGGERQEDSQTNV